MTLIRKPHFPAIFKAGFLPEIRANPRAGFFKAVLNILPFCGRMLPVFLLSTAFTGQAWAESGGEAAVKTAFLYNFFKFIEWPKAIAGQSAYNLCTLDNDPLGDNLLALENKSIGNKPIAIHQNTPVKDLKTCQMVFIGSPENTGAILRDLKGAPVVIVSDQPDFINQGGMIGLVQNDNHLGFEINLDAANAAGIHISAQLLKLAKNVNSTK
jgi:hypothetical protein